MQIQLENKRNLTIKIIKKIIKSFKKVDFELII